MVLLGVCTITEISSSQAWKELAPKRRPSTPDALPRSSWGVDALFERLVKFLRASSYLVEHLLQV